MDVRNKTRASVCDEAAEWFVRMRAADCTGRDREAFEAWLRSDGANWRAYADAERVTRRVDQLIESDASLRAMADDACASAPAGPRHRWAVPTAIAASLLVAVVGVRLADSVLVASPAAQSVANTSDRQRHITLSDHSVVHLDVGSEVTVAIGPESRLITLTRGRALFEVAKDPERPFVVTAGDTRTTALGTVFQVQRDAESVVVVLTEGSVAVGPANERNTWQEHLAPGEQLRLQNSNAAPVKQPVDGFMATSWSRGRLLFRGTRLAEALDEVNRYSSRKVRLADPSLADLPVGGNFIAGDSELIVSALVAALPIRSVDGGGGEILLFRRYETDFL